MFLLSTEDAKSNTVLVQNLLSNCGVVYTLLNEATPPEQKLKPTEKNWSKPRGVHQRNAGLHWIRDAFRGLPPNQIEGVIYFAGNFTIIQNIKPTPRPRAALPHAALISK